MKCLWPLKINHWLIFSEIFFISISFNCFSQQTHYLKLTDVIQSVDCFYPQIKIAHLDIVKAKGDYISALGKFDPHLNLNSLSQPVGGYKNNYGDTEITIPTLYNGLTLFSGYRNGQGNWPVYYQNYLTNSGGEYRGGLSLPLLRGRIIDKERTALLTQKENILIKKQDAALTKLNVYHETIKAYWQWVQAGLQVKTFNQLLVLAKTRQKAIIKQAEQGDLPNLAIDENLQQILQREQLLNQGKMIFEQAAVHLSLYYRDQYGNPNVPKERQLPPAVNKSVRPTLSALQLAQHPILKRLENYSTIFKLKRNLAQNELLPNLDATAYTSKQNGTRGDPLLIPQVAAIGVSLKFPLFQRDAKGKLISAHSQLQQITTKKKFIFEQLNNELTNLFLSIKMYHRQVELLNKELMLAKRVENGETTKFYEGDSTLFLVNQREQATAQVRLNWINAQVKLEEMIDLARFFSSTDFYTHRK